MKPRLATLCLFFCLWGSTVFAQQKAWVDSVYQSVCVMPDSARLIYLKDEMQKNEQNASRLDYARLLYQEANLQNEKEYIADAIYMFARHFYVTNSDSMHYWVKEAEPIFIRLNRLEDICRIKAWGIYLLNREERYDEVPIAAEELKQFSDRVNFPEGKEMADQALADYYFSNQLPIDAERLYVNVLKRMEEREAPMIKKFNILRQLWLKVQSGDKRMQYLHQAEKYLNEAKEAGIEHFGTEYPVFSLEYMIHRGYASELIRQNRLPEAWEHLQQLESLASTHKMVRAESELAHSFSMYYEATGDYEKSLQYLEKDIEYLQRRNITSLIIQRLLTKADLLDKLGHSHEAYVLSQELINMQDSVKTQDFHNTLANVRTQHEVERLELDRQRMEESAVQTRNQLTILLVGCIVLILVIIGLIYLIRVIQHNRRKLRIAKEKAEEADRLKSTFLANMNHEIRTPLNAIVGFSQILIEEEDKEARLEYANIIQNNNELLQRIISDVLDISKIDSNSMSLIYSSQNLPTIMKEIYNMFSLRMQPGVELILDPCEPCIMETDRNRLQQILSNLLGNAVKHTPSGHIRFGYQLLGEEVKFYVEDTGTGIPEEEQKTIFDRFVQLSHGKKGVGLGLAICRGLVTKMGGSISVTSHMGEGSTFYVIIPILPPSK